MTTKSINRRYFEAKVRGRWLLQIKPKPNLQPTDQILEGRNVDRMMLSNSDTRHWTRTAPGWSFFLLPGRDLQFLKSDTRSPPPNRTFQGIMRFCSWGLLSFLALSTSSVSSYDVFSAPPPSSSAAPICSWCESDGPDGYSCDLLCDLQESLLPTSISAQVDGRGFPFFEHVGQDFTSRTPRPEVEVGIIVHHGAGRNGYEYLCYMSNAVRAATGVAPDGSPSSRFVVVAPQVYELSDYGLNTSKMIYWDEDGLDDDGPDALNGQHDWKWGGDSTRDLPAGISTFAVLDTFIEMMSDKSVYPNLRSIVVAGHSAGGQLIQRYALFNRVDAVGGWAQTAENTPIIDYVVANPSSEAYLDGRRAVNDIKSRNCENLCNNSTLLEYKFAFEVPDKSLSECPASYDYYGYGLDPSIPLPSYPSTTGRSQAIAQYGSRSVTYLAGLSDVCDHTFMVDNACVEECDPDDGGLDTSCEGEVQGPCRLARLLAYKQYVNVFYGKETHELLTVPYVGHSGCGMFQSKEFGERFLTR